MKIKIYQKGSAYTVSGIIYLARDEVGKYLASGSDMDTVITDVENDLKGETFIKDVEIGE